MSQLDSDVWYVIRTKPKQEERAALNLENQGFEVFAPKLTVKKLRRGVRTSVVEPMFPNYLFVRLDDIIEQFYKIRSTYGVAGVLRFGNNIPKIPQQWVDEMKGVDELTDEQAPKVGDSVEIQQGPFRGFLAKIVQLDGESRCFVMLEWMQKEVKANFSYKELQFK
ncbi:transcription/translation regulatory transformer protein RfaH [Idiomarina sp. 29L]|uniref:transcription/translation regulatory transformer protein RfaH n=1 Tax=Idiomarina sp. 29L TaxID=2508877 RepID=UPI0010128691|nr:transcription/translation regulatory transformer protein RfaH [Idiomarina sp. 29L]RXS43043.1 transcription/translation regulatory transformer protein RfaH [Idiomarina sp. 29L]